MVAKSVKRKAYPERMRRITALVEVNGVDVEMVFFSNNMKWAASSICDLYKSRWSIETFFKQTLSLGSFLGHNRSAIEWQVWTALRMYVLLRFLHACCDWKHSFTRLYTSLRFVLWQRRNILSYLKSYGTLVKWNDLVKKHHYLNSRLVGPQLSYVAELDGEWVVLASIG